jgi:hypothetical protein
MKEMASLLEFEALCIKKKPVIVHPSYGGRSKTKTGRGRYLLFSI